MTKRGLRVRLGLFVVLASILFGMMIVMFNSLPELFRRTTTYTVRLTDAPGLAPGAPVRRSGVRIGEVRDIFLDEERGIVRVKVAIRAPYTLRKNEQATLMTGLFGSDATLDFLPVQLEDGEPMDRGPVEPGAELVGARAATMGTLLKGASEVVPSTQETLTDIRKSIQRLEKLAARIEKSIPLADDTLRSYRALAMRAEKSIPEFEKTNAQMQELIRTARGVVPDIQVAVDQYRQLARTAETAIPEFSRTAREVGELARGLNNALPTAEATAEEFRDLAADLRKMRPRIEGVMDDFGGAARAGQKLIEEVDVFWQKNRDPATEAVSNLNKNLAQLLKLASDENINKINTTITNVRTASESFPQISRNMSDISEQGRTTVRRTNDMLAQLEKPIAQMPRVIEDIQKFVTGAQGALTDVQRLTGPLGSRSERISRNIDEAIEKVNATLTDVRALFATIDRSDGLVKKVLTDASLYNNLDAASVMVLKMIPRIDRILKDFETFADKVARHPESLGVGGAVRPGSGLKNPPTPPLGAQPHGPVPGHAPSGAPILHTPFLAPRK